MISTVQDTARITLNIHNCHVQFNEKSAIHTSFVQGSQPDGERFGQQSGLLNEVLFHLAPKQMEIEVRFLSYFCKICILDLCDTSLHALQVFQKKDIRKL